MSPDAASPPPAIPRALVEPARGRSWAWLLPLAAAAFAGFLGLEAWVGRGELITVTAREGHGIKASDTLRYRGIQVGSIEGAHLAEDLSSVVLTVRLAPRAEAIARAQSRFWLVRPELSLSGVQGLETIVGARYLAVLPGPADGEHRDAFVALEQPPISEAIDPGGLRLTLAAPSRFHLAPGAPLSYRQIQIGTVLAVALAGDARSVEIEAYVRSDYVHLVRRDSRFWEVGGLELGLDFSQGFRLEVGSLRSLVVGGIAMATPDQPGPPVEDGERFALYGEPQAEWLEWSPSLPVGSAPPRGGPAAPAMARAQLVWRAGRLLARRQVRIGWLLPVAAGWIGPADLLSPVAGARDGGAVLEVGGQVIPLTAAPERAGGGLALHPDAGPPGAWPAERVRFEGALEDCIVVGDPSVPPLALSAQRAEPGADGWRLDPSAGFDEGWHGAAVVARSDGKLRGILLLDADGARVARPARAWW